MLLTFKQEQGWVGTSWPDGETGMYTCFLKDEYLEYDLCWRLNSVQRYGIMVSYTSTVYKSASILENRTAGRAKRRFTIPTGKDWDRIWEATWDANLKATIVVENEDYKLFDEMISAYPEGFESTLQFYVRDENLYQRILDGYTMETRLTMWDSEF